MRVLAIIPARYASTRFPGKPLAQLGGQALIVRVWNAVARMATVDNVVVATDDERIASHMRQQAGEHAVVMTSDKHHSGTDRCAEVVERLAREGDRYDVVVNVQGDEPFVKEEQIESLVACFDDPTVDIATLATAIRTESELRSADNVKVVCTESGRALYFSRAVIPFPRGGEVVQAIEQGRYLKHVGIYAYRAETLLEIARLQPTWMEDCEKLEQLRWLGEGYSISVRRTPHANIGIDTPEDLEAARRIIEAQENTTNEHPL